VTRKVRDDISKGAALRIRQTVEEDYESILEVAEKLRTIDDKKGWFTEEARKKFIPRDLRTQKGFVAEEDGKIVGFITYTTEKNNAEIGWIGVDPDYHRKKIGRLLVERVENDLRGIGVVALRVETPTKEEGIGSSYEGTYKFYESCEFEVEKTRFIESEGIKTQMAILNKSLK